MQKSPAFETHQKAWPLGFWASAVLAVQMLVSLISAVIFQSQAVLTLVTLDVIWMLAIAAHIMLIRQHRMQQAGMVVLTATGAKAALTVLASPELFPVMVLLPGLAAGYVLLRPQHVRGRLLAGVTSLSYVCMLLAYRLAAPANDLPRVVTDLLLLVGIPAGGVTLFQMIAHYRRQVDVTLRRTQHQNLVLQQTINQQHHLLEVSRVISAHTCFNSMLDAVLEELQSTVPCESATVTLVDSDCRVTDCRVSGSKTLLASQLAKMRRLPAHHLQVLTAERPLLVGDVCESGPEAHMVRAALENNPPEGAIRAQSWIGVPLTTQGKTIGLLSLSHSQRKYFGPQQARMAQAFANQVAAAIQSVRHKDQAVKAAAMTERARLSRDLHDSVSQSIFGVSLGVRTGLELLPPGSENAQKPIVYALDLAEAALTQMRALIFELRPESLQEEGLVKALRRQAAGVIARYKADCGSQLHLDLGEREPEISLDAKEALYRISLEALQNAGRHAQASDISLTMTCDDATVRLMIQDNGRGFDPNASYSGHLGLKTMRERAGIFGGRVDIDSAPGRGTSIAVVLPVER